MTELSIGQLAAKAEVNASTLRYYETVGLLEAPRRQNGQRRYDEQLLERIHFIKIAQQTGFSVKEIALMLEGLQADAPLSAAWERMAQRKRVELEERKKQIESMLHILDSGLNCKCLTWSECLDNIQQNGSCSEPGGSTGHS